MLILAGTLVMVGILYLLIGRVPYIGRLPGDFVIHRGSATLYIPIVTSIIFSFILVVILNAVFRIYR